MCYVCDVLYICVNCCVVHGCAVSRRYINVCNNEVFIIVNMYLENMKFCGVCINGRRYVLRNECYVVPNKCLV